MPGHRIRLFLDNHPNPQRRALLLGTDRHHRIPIGYLRRSIFYLG
jgi:hypothetical protein